MKLRDESASDLSHSVANSSHLSTRNGANQIRKMMIYVNSCLLVLCNNETMKHSSSSLSLTLSPFSDYHRYYFRPFLLDIWVCARRRSVAYSIFYPLSTRKSKNKVKICFAIFRSSTSCEICPSSFYCIGLSSFCSTYHELISSLFKYIYLVTFIVCVCVLGHSHHNRWADLRRKFEGYAVNNSWIIFHLGLHWASKWASACNLFSLLVRSEWWTSALW